jgi:hypothetical protein
MTYWLEEEGQMAAEGLSPFLSGSLADLQTTAHSPGPFMKGRHQGWPVYFADVVWDTIWINT